MLFRRVFIKQGGSVCQGKSYRRLSLERMNVRQNYLILDLKKGLLDLAGSVPSTPLARRRRNPMKNKITAPIGIAMSAGTFVGFVANNGNLFFHQDQARVLQEFDDRVHEPYCLRPIHDPMVKSEGERQHLPNFDLSVHH